MEEQHQVALDEALAEVKQIREADPFSVPAITAGGMVQDYWVRLALGLAQKNTQAVRDALDAAQTYRSLKALRSLLERAAEIEERVSDRVEIFNKQAASVETLKVAMQKLEQAGENGG
jgi:hypothetical protein